MRFLTTRPLRGLAAVTVLGTLAFAGPMTTTTAEAASSVCATDPGPGRHDASAAARVVGGPGAVDDSVDLNAAERARTAAQLAEIADQHRSARASALPEVIVVPVYAHIIKGTHSYDSYANATQVHQAVRLLRDGFKGLQDPENAHATRFSFTLKKIDVTKNDKWYHASLYNTVDKQAKEALHLGGRKALNLYFSAPQSAGRQLLGYARFPWQIKSTTTLKWDGVTVHVGSLAGGKLAGYNQGDTLIHEVGHWLGLLHTFEGEPCSPVNDGVADTPAQSEPSVTCATPGNTAGDSTVCDPNDVLLGGLTDPMFNFMDYSLDSCMVMFTEGQSQRMDFVYPRYRY